MSYMWTISHLLILRWMPIGRGMKEQITIRSNMYSYVSSSIKTHKIALYR